MCVETVRHAFHLGLGTKLSKLLCLIYCGFGKTHEVLFRLRNVVIVISIALRRVFSDILSSKEAAYAR